MTRTVHRVLALLLGLTLWLCLSSAACAKEVGAEPVSVVFLMDEEELLAFVSVTDADGNTLDPTADPDTGAPRYGRYLLMPGEYVCRFRDETGVYADLEERFSVGDCLWQYVPLHPEKDVEELTFSFAWVNPLYADVVSEQDLPALSTTPEEILADLREMVDTQSESSWRRDAKYRSESGVFNETIAEAAAELKQQIMTFEDTATILLFCDSKPDEAQWKSLCASIFKAAIAHTGVPTEGDYLRYEYGGFNAGGAIVQKDGRYACKFVYQLKHFTNAAQEAELDEYAAGVLESLELAEKNDYQKALAIYQYLTSRVIENGSGDLKYTAYGALIQRGALCQGIASAFYRLCLAAGVDNRMVPASSMSHVWNIVRMGDLYYELDATWDIRKTPENFRFFLRGSEYWLANHHNGGGSVIGDSFNDSSFAAQYPLPAFDYAASITVQPVSEKVFEGRTVSFSVTAVGGELQYRWQTCTDEESEWQTIPDAVGNTLTLTPTQNDNGRLYRCEVSNLAGPVYSEAAELTVYPEPDLVLPSYLCEIGEEAFQGGAFSCVSLPDTTVRIEANAFADCPNLHSVYFLATTTDIDPDAFGETENLTVYGREDSTAAAFAETRGFAFVKYE